MANGNSNSVEIELNTPKPEVIQYIRLSEKSTIYFDSWKQKTYLCLKCKSVVASKVDHTRWHQDMLDLMIAIAYKTIPLEDLRQMSFQPVEVNPIKKPSFG